MKKIIKFSTLILIVSGLSLSPILYQNNEVLTGIHIILGFIYTVLFLLFSFDHISTHKESLPQIGLKNAAGLMQVSLGLIILFSGFVLYLFGSLPMTPWTEIHLIATVIYLVSTGTHFFSK
ncbi:MAG: hypothetical protein GY786_11170 [Proteobacteria bacterium]|nr:hypothetical protein [Pseudomonadota bacterium]